ncbi:MAG: SMC-Scp complex subunit ScpB [Acidobacteriota bacterium]
MSTTSAEDMEAVVEAILFVSSEPVSRAKLAQVFGDDEETRVAADAAIDAVVERWREREHSGVMIDEVAGGLRLVSRPDLHGFLRRFFEVSGSNRLSMPALETLAIVAYRQPVTAPEIQELRGVNSSGVLKTLLERRLVRIAGRKEVVGKPFLYATTREFLMHFGLRSLKELPPLEQFEEMLGADPEAGGAADVEEEVLQAAAALDDAEDAAAEQAEIEEIERERAEAEELEASEGSDATGTGEVATKDTVADGTEVEDTSAEDATDDVPVAAALDETPRDTASSEEDGAARAASSSDTRPETETP